ncbi:MAG: hypothetical protein ABI615_13020 [Chthoniobacterales bacterium]
MLLLLPEQAGKIAPRLFEGEMVHTAFAATAALLGSAGLFLSLVRILTSNSRSGAILPFLCFLIFFALVFSFYTLQLKESYIHREQASDLLSSKALPMSLHRLTSEATPEERQAIAMGIFRVYGVSILYEAKKGQYGFYRPMTGDVEEQGKFRLIAQKSTQILAAFNFEIAELQQFILIYAASLFAVFGIGGVWIALQKSPAVQDDLEPPTL